MQVPNDKNFMRNFHLITDCCVLDSFLYFSGCRFQTIKTSRKMFTWWLTAAHLSWQHPSPSCSFGLGRLTSSLTDSPDFIKLELGQSYWKINWKSHLCRPTEGDKTSMSAQQDIFIFLTTDVYHLTCQIQEVVEKYQQREFPELLAL